VNNRVRVAIVHCLQNLLHNFTCFVLIKVFRFHYLIEQFAASAQLRHDVVIVLFFIEFVDLNDIRVILRKKINQSVSMDEFEIEASKEML